MIGVGTMQNQLQNRQAMAIVGTVLILAFVTVVAADDVVVGCGGFVQASSTLAKLRKPTDPKLDYSHITVELQNEEGLVKDRTQCAPNGYYFLPTYEKGSFVISINGPQGWTFEPRQVPVVVDQASCNNNEDINFRYTGFSLSGRVTSAVGGASCPDPRGQGPAGVEVTLTPVKEDGIVAADARGEASVVTGAGGEYLFTGLPTGKYKIKAAHPIWKISTIGSTEIELGWGSAEVPDAFQVAGYDLQGSVLAQGNPVLGVQVYLYSDDVQSVACPLGPGESPLSSKFPLCHTVTGADGKFLFPTLPCGEYTLVPFYKGEVTVFDVSPRAVTVKVGHGSTVLGKPFEVTGFSVGGRVADTAGKGIGGVQILIDGSVRATTDSQGNYKLDQVTSAVYTISASKVNYKFGQLEKLSVLPNMAALPTIQASEYALCGKILLDGDKFSGKRQVALTHGPENVKPQAKSTDESGEFCFMVPPGSYLLSPVVSAAETAAGLLFSPASLDVTVASQPLTGVVFKQGRLSISGRVKCLDFCPASVKLTLTALNPKSGAGVQSVYLPEDGDKFVFDEVVPGTYELRVENEPPLEARHYGDRWCWERNSQRVEVRSQDVTGVTFAQTGYVLRINSTHETETHIVNDNSDPMIVAIKRGMQEVCLPVGGEHIMLFMDNCVFFGALMLPYNTDNPEPAQLVAQKISIVGHIKVDSRLWKEASNLSDYMFPSVFYQDGTPIDQQNFAVLDQKANQTHPWAVYEYSYWGEQGDKLMIIPRHNGRLQEEVKTEEDFAEEHGSQEGGSDQSGPSPGLGAMSREDQDAYQRAAQLGREPTIREVLEMQAASNPAITGRVEDVEELQRKQRQRMGLAEEEDEVDEGVGEGGGGSGGLGLLDALEGEEGAKDEREEPAGEDGEDEPPQEEDEETEADPYENLPFTARPFPDPDPTWPPLRRVLFYPRLQYVAIDVDGCQPPIPPFEARPGVYLEGHVVPPLPGVNMTVVADTPSETAGWKAGQEVLWTLTQEEGRYVAGPLYDDATYSVLASKEGYDFRAIDKFSFEGQRLAEIRVTIRPGPGAEPALPSVLLSLSGEKGYRKNAPTPVGEGLSFGSLFPGSFYLRPLLKEYSFSPPAQAIEVQAGETKEVTFEAQRVAFSILGSVSSLSGQPEEGVPVEARSEEGGRYETTTTDDHGRFRLRGLLPGTKYRVGVVLKEGAEGSSGIERASPQAVEVTVFDSDVAGIDFLVFDHSSGSILTGTVEGPEIDKWQPNLSIEVSRASDPSQIERSVPLPLSGFFEIHDLPRGEYVVRVNFGLSTRTHTFDSEAVDANLLDKTVVHVGPLKFRAAERQADQNLTSAAVLPLVFSIGVIVLLASLSQLKDAYLWLTGGGTSGGGSTPTTAGGGWFVPGEVKKKDPKKPTLRKRTY